MVRPRASRPEADYPEGRLARRRILARRRTFNNRCAIYGSGSEPRGEILSPRGRGVVSEGEKLLLGARAPFLTGPEKIPNLMSFMAID